MSISISSEVLRKSESERVKNLIRYSRDMIDGEIEVDSSRLNYEDYKELHSIAQELNDKKSLRVLSVALSYMEFDKEEAKISNFRSFYLSLTAYLKARMINGWIFFKAHDGRLYPFLVTSLEYSAGDKRNKIDPSVNMTMKAYSFMGKDSSVGSMGEFSKTVSFSPSDCIHRTVTQVLIENDLYAENDDRINEYEEYCNHYNVIRKLFSQQLLYSGTPLISGDRHASKSTMNNIKVIHDTDTTMFKYYKPTAYSRLFGENYNLCLFAMKSDKSDLNEAPKRSIKSMESMSSSEVIEADSFKMPIHTLIRVFDLKKHTYFIAHTSEFSEYTYKPELRHSLILPETHTELLDILTEDLSMFTTEIIDGKLAGNIILCRGTFGLGKTLTAEIYSEIVGRPLYSIHSGTLGTKASDIRTNLEKVFGLVKRWNCILLIDECDVFLRERGDNIEANAICAEFLRTIEYFDGLCFLTTNSSSILPM